MGALSNGRSSTRGVVPMDDDSHDAQNACPPDTGENRKDELEGE